MSPTMFRRLTEKEEDEFRQSARDNYKHGEAISPIWHPVYQLECAKMNFELYKLVVDRD